MALEWVVLGYAAGAEAIMVLLLTLPGLGRLRKVRDSAELRIARLVHAIRASTPPEVDHEEPAQCALDCLGVDLLLDSVLRDPFDCSDRAVESAHREVEESGLMDLGRIGLREK
ncbi:hypothetical protein F0562_032667 [Nyssa sinensis]|uniref:Endoplasmic reticulum transmembrane protein n=1 Tax=Nyssa sinensis TaxID=561372 RepID=A0A5J5ASY5_9ASTE|nr:hypothetical protein F0562_032667 [Nyssa sinensis]